MGHDQIKWRVRFKVIALPVPMVGHYVWHHDGNGRVEEVTVLAYLIHANEAEIIARPDSYLVEKPAGKSFYRETTPQRITEIEDILGIAEELEYGVTGYFCWWPSSEEGAIQFEKVIHPTREIAEQAFEQEIARWRAKQEKET